jgi:hypothetical protein
MEPLFIQKTVDFERSVSVSACRRYSADMLATRRYRHPRTHPEPSMVGMLSTVMVEDGCCLTCEQETQWWWCKWCCAWDSAIPNCRLTTRE